MILDCKDLNKSKLLKFFQKRDLKKHFYNIVYKLFSRIHEDHNDKYSKYQTGRLMVFYVFYVLYIIIFVSISNIYIYSSLVCHSKQSSLFLFNYFLLDKLNKTVTYISMCNVMCFQRR